MFKISESAKPANSIQVAVLTKPKLNAFVSFYKSVPHSNGTYGKKDKSYNGEFGFDKFDKKVMADGLMRHYTTLSGVETKDSIIDSQENYSYLCPFLSIWPPDVDGNLDNSKSKVTVYVKLEKDKNFKKRDPDLGGISFESSDSASVIIEGAIDGIKKIPLEIKSDAVELTLECLQPFSTEILITATTTKGDIIGQLIIYPNNIRYKTTIQPVWLEFEKTASNTIVKKPHNSFIQTLIKEFNNNAFNQAYIHAELASDTDVLTLERNEFSKFMSAEGYKMYLKKKSVNDPLTALYNDTVEKRYASIVNNEEAQNKAEEDVKSAIGNLIDKFDNHYNFSGSGKEYTIQKHEDTIVTKAWNQPDVKKALDDYEKAWKEFNNLDTECELDKEHKIHLFLTNYIYAAKKPSNKVAAYSHRNSGIAYVFDFCLSGKQAITDVLHEIGHSLGLKHTFENASHHHNETATSQFEIFASEDEREIINNKIEELEKSIRSNEDQKKKLSFSYQVRALETYYSKIIKNAIARKRNFQLELKPFRDDFIDRINEAKSMESAPLGYDTSSVEYSEAVKGFDDKIKEYEAEIALLKTQRDALPPETAVVEPTPIEEPEHTDEADGLSKKTEQSTTLENYMDYTQYKQEDPEAEPEYNNAVKRKMFYKWHWDEMREVGKENNYLIEQQ